MLNISDIVGQTKAACALVDSAMEILNSTNNPNKEEKERTLELLYQACDLVDAAVAGMNSIRETFEFAAMNSEIDDYGRVIVRRILRKYA